MYMDKKILTIDSLVRRFGGLTAVSDVSFDVNKGEIFGIIGPNGAGKTTLFNVIAGFYKPTRGKVIFNENLISGLASDEIARLGIGRTFQSIHSFKDQTVLENLKRANTLSRYYNLFSFITERKINYQCNAVETAAFIGLSNVLHSKAGNLSYGQQKILGIGMSIMASPKLLLMDEPAAGLNPSEKRDTAILIKKLRDEMKITVLIVEHDMPLVMGICDRILVVKQGTPIAIGTPEKIKADKSVIDAYLGEEYEFA